MEKSIYNLTLSELISEFKISGKSKYRAEQVWKYLYRDKINEFTEMIELNSDCIQLLEQKYVTKTVSMYSMKKSKDGTIKFLFSLYDGHLIETVLMRHPFGNSACVTTQIGCNIGCSFCASGLYSKIRDLSSGEIVEQILAVQDYLDEWERGETVTNVVVMGIGEPFDNFQNLIKTLEIIIDHKGMSIPGKSITVSTSGIADKIRKFADINLPVNLAISLHAPNDKLRSSIMRINKVVPISELMHAIEYYVMKTNRRLTIEYIMLKGVNDSEIVAEELSNLLKKFGRKVYVNLIPYNPVDTLNRYERSDDEAIKGFCDVIIKSGTYCKIRHEHGCDIDAACGQLRNKEIYTQ